MWWSVIRIFVTIVLSHYKTDAINPEFLHEVLEKESSRINAVSILTTHGNL